MKENPNINGSAGNGARPFRVDDWDVDPALLEVSRQGEVRHLEPRVMQLLTYLAQRAGETISREQFLEEVWGDRIVVEAVLTQAISQLRGVLGDDGKAPRYVQTVHRRGYRLIAPVQWLDAPTPATGPAPAPVEPSPSEICPPPRGRLLRWVPAALLVVLSVLALAGVRQRTRSGSPRPHPSIAVLPFEDRAEAGEDYLASALTEMLIADLSKIQGLKVISLASAMRYREFVGGIPEFSSAADVETVLKGSVARSGDLLRVSAHLFSGKTGELLWARNYDRQWTDLFGLQSNISQTVAGEVQAHFTLDRLAERARNQSIDPEAYRRYLQGRLSWGRRGRANLWEAKEHFETAIALVPDFALAYAGLADTIIQLSNHTEMPPEEAMPKAEMVVEKALELDPDLGEAHATLGLIRAAYYWDWPAAESSYRQAIELQPSYATAHQWYAECLSFVGRHEEALNAIERAVELDPLNPLMLAVWGQRLNAAGYFPEAIERLETAAEQDSELSWAYRELAFAYRSLGDLPAALANQREWLRLRGWNTEELAELDRAVATEGDSGFWRIRLNRLLATDNRWVPAVEIAEAYAALGQTDEAIAWLSRAVEERSEYFPHVIKSPLFDSLVGDPHFALLLEESGVARGRSASSATSTTWKG